MASKKLVESTNKQPLVASWRVLLLGALLGYLMAIMTIVVFGTTGSTTATTTTTSTTTFGSSSSYNHILKTTARRFLSHEVLAAEEGESGSEHAGEEGEEEEEEEGEGHHGVDGNTMDITVTVIILLLIILTIAFEEAKEHIEETAPRGMKPIISSLFGEMTILGFLSIFTFCVTRLGVFTELSMAIFGHEEEEELLETFEAVHYMLFFVMVFFVISVLTIVSHAKDIEKRWKTMNVACQDSEYMEKVYALDEEDHSKNFFAYFCDFIRPGTANKDFRKDLKLFAAIRHEFLLDRSPEPPFAPKEEDADKRLPADFHFGRYLSINLNHTLEHSVHVQVSTWIFFAVLTIVLAAINAGVTNDTEAFAWIWVGAGWVSFVFGKYFDYHIISILQTMAAPKSALSPTASSNGDTESDSLLDSTLPEWTKIDLEEYNAGRGCCTRNIASDCVTRQDSLFWLDRSGPRLYHNIMQIQLVFISAYATLLCLKFFPYVFKEESTPYIVAYTILSLIPLLYRLLKQDLSAAKLTMAVSIGVHRRPNVIAQVTREEKTDRIIRALVTTQKLQAAAKNGFAAAADPASGDSTVNTMSSSEMAEVCKIFDAFDKSKDGEISSDELKDVMTKIGSPPTEESLQAMLSVLDTNRDGNITKDEFIAFYAANVVVDPDEHSLHHLAHEMFHQFDIDKSGEITLGEFKDVLEAFNVGFTVDEIGDLVNELDEDNQGTIHAHEFHELLEKHKYLFEDMKPPPIE